MQSTSLRSAIQALICSGTGLSTAANTCEVIFLIKDAILRRFLSVLCTQAKNWCYGKFCCISECKMDWPNGYLLFCSHNAQVISFALSMVVPSTVPATLDFQPQICGTHMKIFHSFFTKSSGYPKTLCVWLVIRPKIYAHTPCDVVVRFAGIFTRFFIVCYMKSSTKTAK